MPKSEDTIDYTIAEEFGPESQALEIKSGGRTLVRILSNGTLEYGPNYTPDEAAVIFWETMGRKRIEAEDRLLLINHIEALVTRLGIVDLQNEAAQRQVGLEPSLENLNHAAQMQAALERVMHQTIELGRGLARRPGILPPPVPNRVPQQILQDDLNNYTGREGLVPPEPTDEE